MQLVVTAAGTALGQALLRALVARGELTRGGGGPEPLRRILAVDRSQPAALFVHEGIEYVQGEYHQPRFFSRMMGAATDSVFHLSAWYAGAGLGMEAEAMELALLRSWDTTRALLEACRLQSHAPRLVFAGRAGLRRSPGDVPSGIDAVCADACESLLAEAARRGIVDLRSVRLPPDAADGADEDGAPPADRWALRLIEAHERPGEAPGVQIVEAG